MNSDPRKKIKAKNASFFISYAIGMSILKRFTIQHMLNKSRTAKINRF